MTREKFLNEIDNSLNNITLDESKKIIHDVSKKLEESKYEIILSIISNVKNIKRDSSTLKKEYEIVKKQFQKIEDGEMCIRCYDTTGYGGNYYFYPSNKLNNILNNAMN